MNAVAEKFEQFEWLTHGLTPSSPSIEPQVRGTGEKALNYQDRLGAIASMDTQLEKSITSVIVFGEKSKGDFDFVQNYLAKIMIANALSDKRREPEGIQLNYLAVLIARMVIDFSIDPELENNFTAQGRLYYAGIRTHQMSVDQYRKTWKQYENMMVIALEVSIKNAGEAIHKYRKESYKG